VANVTPGGARRAARGARTGAGQGQTPAQALVKQRAYSSHGCRQAFCPGPTQVAAQAQKSFSGMPFGQPNIVQSQ
jgi:hypothetical protein